jgi:tRNA-dihydrouridine synthase
MAKLNNTQIDALVSEARQKIENANKSKVEKFAKTNKKLAEYLKLAKQYEDLRKKKDEVDRTLQHLRAGLNTSTEFVKNNLSLNYNGEVQVDTWRIGSELRNKIILMTIEKDAKVEDMIERLIANYIK